VSGVVSSGADSRASSADVVDGSVRDARWRRAGARSAVDDRQPADRESAGGVTEARVARLGGSRRRPAGQLHAVRRQHRTVVHRTGPSRRLWDVSIVRMLPNNCVCMFHCP